LNAWEVRVAEHPSLEQLQAYAADQPDAADRAHVDDCEVCRANLALLREIDGGLSALPELSAPRAEWQNIARRLNARRRRPLLAAGMAFVALLGGTLLFRPWPATDGGDPVAQLVEVYQLHAANPKQQAAALEALSDATHEALEQEPGNPALHDLAYQIDRKRAETGAPSVPLDTAAYEALRIEAAGPIENIARRAPRVALFAENARAFAGARLEPVTDGLRVVDVVPGSAAARAGLLPDDVLLAGDGNTLASVDALAAAAADGAVRLEARRGGAHRTLILESR
jgi:hypothetical protein